MSKGRLGEEDVEGEANDPGIDWEAVDKLKSEFQIDDVLEGQFEEDDEDSERENAEGEDVGDEGPTTTVMLRNLPKAFLREDLLHLLASEGFGMSYDFIYIPIHFAFGFNFGYAFINLVSTAEAHRFHEHFEGFTRWGTARDRGTAASVSWGERLRTLEQQVARYRNSPILHPYAPDGLKPCLFRDGERIPFPPPTRRVRPPRKRKTGRFSA